MQGLGTKTQVFSASEATDVDLEELKKKKRNTQRGDVIRCGKKKEAGPKGGPSAAQKKKGTWRFA